MLTRLFDSRGDTSGLSHAHVCHGPLSDRGDRRNLTLLECRLI